MKDFLYLDTDYLDSYLSQINNGLIERTSDSITDQNEATTTSSGSEKGIETEAAIEGKVGIPGITGIKGNGKTKGTWKAPTSVSSFAETEIGQSIITKTVHDDAFNAFFSYLQENGMCFENPTLNKFFFKSIDFRIMDLNYMFEIFNNRHMQKITPGLKKDAKLNDGQLLNPFNTIELLIQLLPYKSFLYSNSYIVPLKEGALREKSNELLFKYSGKITILGKVNRQLGHNKEMNKLMDITPDALEVTYEAIDDLFLSMMQALVVDFSKKPYVISPIAIYVE
ncbi:DUF6414 family protein [Acetobacterium malicum]|uniref:DUF6414 family protein n=1 Tax=Acetobacterium malicum TaxID=52692 RepID=UPI000426E686|nr:hypothetical protein [Acetobacterium dehalogenans]